jgi:hypothetical protein
LASAAVPASINKSAQYENATTNTFIAALKNATQGLSSGSGSFALTGTYTMMDMSGFADRLQSCNVDLTKAKIKQVEYAYTFQNGQLLLDLMSFDICCTGTCDAGTGWVTIASAGWDQ